jgi:hypothetical protein
MAAGRAHWPRADWHIEAQPLGLSAEPLTKQSFMAPTKPPDGSTDGDATL